MLRRTKDDLVNKLPDKIEMNISLPLSPLQHTMYKELLSTRKVDSFTSMSGGAFKMMLMQVRKCANHPYMFPDVEDEGTEEYGEHIVDNCSKMQFIDKLLKKNIAANE